jgi:hypothetical protein
VAPCSRRNIPPLGSPARLGSVVAVTPVVVVPAVAVALARILRLVSPFGDAARAILPAVVVATLLHPAHVLAALRCPAFLVPALIGALPIGALPIALLGDTALLIAPLFRSTSFVPTHVRAALGGTTLFHAAHLGSVSRGVAALLDAAAFGAFGGGPSLVTVVLATTVRPGLRRSILSIRDVAVAGRAGTHSILIQLPRLFAEDDPAAIGMVIPTTIHQIRGLPAVIRPRIALHSRRGSLDVLDGLIVHQLAARVRHATWQRGGQRYAKPESV